MSAARAAGHRHQCSVHSGSTRAVWALSTSQCEIQRAIDLKCEADELRQVVRDQAVVNATVVMDSSFGRWIWKGGKTKRGGVVPWNVQVGPIPYD